MDHTPRQIEEQHQLTAYRSVTNNAELLEGTEKIAEFLGDTLAPHTITVIKSPRCIVARGRSNLADIRALNEGLTDAYPDDGSYDTISGLSVRRVHLTASKNLLSALVSLQVTDSPAGKYDRAYVSQALELTPATTNRVGILGIIATDGLIDVPKLADRQSLLQRGVFATGFRVDLGPLELEINRE